MFFRANIGRKGLEQIITWDKRKGINSKSFMSCCVE